MPEVTPWVSQWGEKCQEPIRSDNERNSLFSEQYNSKRDLAKRRVSRFVQKWTSALRIHCIEDWEQIACMAMLKAAAMWSADNGTCFLTYAWKVIDRELLKNLEAGGVIRVPIHAKTHKYSADADKARCTWQMGDILSDNLKDKSGPPKEDEDLIKLKSLLWRLSPTQRKIIRERHFEGRTLEDIGNIIGLSKERVRQILRVAIQRLKTIARKEVSPCESQK